MHLYSKVSVSFSINFSQCYSVEIDIYIYIYISLMLSNAGLFESKEYIFNSLFPVANLLKCGYNRPALRLCQLAPIIFQEQGIYYQLSHKSLACISTLTASRIIINLKWVGILRQLCETSGKGDLET